MPAENNDVSFSFDPTPFKNGIEKMNQSMAGMMKNTENLAKKVGTGMMDTVKKVAALAAGFIGVKAIMSKIPEIGMVFKQAGDIFFKNLLWPLRKELMPLLQKMLNWVRDNRGQFVIWGQTIANIFRSIMSVAKVLIDVAKTVGHGFLDFINSVFGSQIKSFGELLNVLTFKFALVAQFIGSIIQSIFGDVNFKGVLDDIGKMIGSVIQFIGMMVGAAWKGFTDAVPDIGATFTSIMDSVKSIMDFVSKIVSDLITGKEASKGWQTVFEVIGNVIGKAVSGLEDMMFILSHLTDPGKIGDYYLKKYGKTDLANTIDLTTNESRHKDAFNKLSPEAQRKLLEAQKEGKLDANFNLIPTQSVHDALITKTGQVIKFDPDDNIMATKGGNNNRQVTVNFGAINLTVTEGSAQAAGNNFINGVYDQIRSRLNMEFIGVGN